MNVTAYIEKAAIAAAASSAYSDDDAYHEPEYAWSTSFDAPQPVLTSGQCAHALHDFFRNPAQLAVATEASSTVTGLASLFAQPYLYAGGGLGNLDECPLQICLAGRAGFASREGSVTFASLCVVPECGAADVAAADFAAVANLVSQPLADEDYEHDANHSNSSSTKAQTRIDTQVAAMYVTNIQRIAKVNKFLKTGWICGDFVVPWEWWPFGIPYIMILVLMPTLALWGTLRQKRKKSCVKGSVARTRGDQREGIPSVAPALLRNFETTGLLEQKENGGDQEEKQDYRLEVKQTPPEMSFWTAFDLSRNLQRLIQQPSRETACLDGLRVGSIFWIMIGHVMAIQSSSGAGYSNPALFLPPNGLTTTVLGQLLFSSRLAVDTFFCISGFLAVHVMVRKLPPPPSLSTRGQSGRTGVIGTVIWRYITTMPSLLVARIIRIWPVYAACIGFYTQIAPHMGSGPFWYQWISLLKPCHDYGWTNFLFINNFFPRHIPTTDTCFYHSWYLAVDMQLFLLAPALVFLYQVNRRWAKWLTVSLWVGSVVLTVYLTYSRGWSVNTFDGAAVARYDIEAYAKPHTRAQAYLAGIFVAMLLPEEHIRARSDSGAYGSRGSPRTNSYTWKHRVVMAVALVTMIFVTFITASGAYARRPCQYHEWPGHDDCGSLWSLTATFLYTALSRAVWTVAVGVCMHLCLGRSTKGNLIAAMLSWRCWTPLSQLSFGVYLIHPIVIFVIQLADREKEVFRLETFCMNCLSVSLVSYVAALIAFLTVEVPSAMLWKIYMSLGSGRSSIRDSTESKEKLASSDLRDSSKAANARIAYGAVDCRGTIEVL